MNVVGALAYAFSVMSASERGGRSDVLVEAIVDVVAAPVSGEHLMRIDMLPRHHAVDLPWAADRVSRQLGTGIQIQVQSPKATHDGRARVRVRAQRPYA